MRNARRRGRLGITLVGFLLLSSVQLVNANQARAGTYACNYLSQTYREYWTFGWDGYTYHTFARTIYFQGAFWNADRDAGADPKDTTITTSYDYPSSSTLRIWVDFVGKTLAQTNKGWLTYQYCWY